MQIRRRMPEKAAPAPKKNVTRTPADEKRDREIQQRMLLAMQVAFVRMHEPDTLPGHKVVTIIDGRKVRVEEVEKFWNYYLRYNFVYDNGRLNGRRQYQKTLKPFEQKVLDYALTLFDGLGIKNPYADIAVPTAEPTY